MYWHELIDGVDVQARGGQGNPAITDVTHDSRKVMPGALYVAVPGLKKHGDSFIEQAVGRGAAAVVSQNPQPQCPVPWIQVPNPRRILGPLARRVWQVSLDNMIVVGITGTNGKTTTAHLFHHLFRSAYGADAAWMFGTIAYVLGETTVDAPNTTPEASDIFRHIGTARRAPKTLTMEVSSHALALDRVGGFAFDLAVWTNLTQDHLDFHKTMEDYYQAKKRLFTEYLKPHGVAAVNIDDEFGKRLVGEISGVPTITFGADQQADVRLAGHTCTWDGTAVEILYQGGTVRFNSSLNGLFNVYNLGMFWAGSRALNRDEAEVAKAATTVPAVKGRIERAKVPTDYTLVVDYAHTPDALEKILVAARSLTKGKLVCVFGCGGDRDRTKRPLMAKTVAQNCDEAVVTSDNPRTEKPTAIIAEVLTGMPLDFPHHVVEDRKEAIRRAMQIARRGDCVVVAGKGHETYQEINGVRHHFDDMEVITDLAGPAQKEIVSV